MVNDSQTSNVPTIKRPTSSAFGRDGVVGGIATTGIGFFLPMLEYFKKGNACGREQKKKEGGDGGERGTGGEHGEDFVSD